VLSGLGAMYGELAFELAPTPYVSTVPEPLDSALPPLKTTASRIKPRSVWSVFRKQKQLFIFFQFVSRLFVSSRSSAFPRGNIVPTQARTRTGLLFLSSENKKKRAKNTWPSTWFVPVSTRTKIPRLCVSPKRYTCLAKEYHFPSCASLY